ncbi:MAG: hypothetical protein RL755_422 [Pseudomonadota bacterium]|jgi:hypothetical protein
MKRITTLCLLVFIYTKPANAEYFAHGDIYGYAYDAIGNIVPHYGKLIAHKVFAIKHEDGKIFNKVRRVYQDTEIQVTPQNECIFRPHGDHPVYLGKKDDGGYEELKIKYIKFECVKH